MLSRIIRIAAMLLGGALLLEGCVRQLDLDPAREGDPISFSAGSTLLRDDATKAGEEPINGESFTEGSKFLVYGRRNTVTPLLFSGVNVTLGSSIWSYTEEAEPRQWDWSNDPVYYFLAVYRGNVNAQGRTYIPTPSNNGSASPFAVTVDYSYNTAVNSTQEQFDLMMGGKRRTYNDEYRTQPVGLQFEHMLAAVKVILKNGSAENNPTAIYLTGYQFEHMVISGQAKVSFDNSGNPTYSWSNTNRLSTPIGVESGINQLLVKDNPETEDVHENTYESNHFHLMIPQLHTGQNGQNYPALVINYKVGSSSGASKSARILLKDIQKGTESDLTNDYLTQWERGKKYVYTIKLDLDGGVIVTVTTTPWDAEIEAETPGLLLPVGY